MTCSGESARRLTLQGIHILDPSLLLKVHTKENLRSTPTEHEYVWKKVDHSHLGISLCPCRHHDLLLLRPEYAYQDGLGHSFCRSRSITATPTNVRLTQVICIWVRSVHPTFSRQHHSRATGSIVQIISLARAAWPQTSLSAPP